MAFVPVNINQIQFDKPDYNNPEVAAAAWNELYPQEETQSKYVPVDIKSIKLDAPTLQDVPDKDESITGKLKSFGKGMGAGASLGFLDEATAAILTPFLNEAGQSYLDTYRQLRSDARESLAKGQSDNPLAYGTGQFVGGTSAILATPLRGTATLGSALKTGAAAGGIEGYGSSNSEDVGNQIYDAVKGAALGTAGGAAGYGLGKIVTSPVTRQLLQDERGAVGRGVGYKAEFSPAERAIARILIEEKGLTPDEAANFVRMAGKPDESGIALTLPEATQSKTLMKYEGRLRENPGAAGEVEAGFLNSRNKENIPTAYTETLNNEIGKVSTPESASKKVSEVAQKIVSAAEAKRQAAAEPFYKMAWAQQVSDEEAGKLLKSPIIKDAYESMANDPVWQTELAKHPQGSLGVFDVVKQNLDSKIAASIQAGDKNRTRILTAAKNDMLSTLDNISPAYKEARSVFAQGSPRIDRLKQTAIGVFNEMKDDPVKAANTLIKSSPAEIRFARRLISASDPDAWNGLVATHLAQIGEKANHSPAKILNALSSKGSAGNVLKEKSLDAMLTPEQRVVKNKLFSALENASSIRQGSNTASNLTTDQMMRDDVLSPLEQLGDSAATGKLTKTELMRRAVAWSQNLIMGKRYEDLAKIFTGKDASDFAERLAKTQPGSFKFWREVNNQIAKSGTASVPAASSIINQGE